MTTPLKPIEASTHARFKLNKQTEFILSVPKDRDDNITFTMGGRSDHPVTLTLEEFEDSTGHYIEGLEPHYEFDVDEVLSELEDSIVDTDFTVNKVDEVPYEQTRYFDTLFSAGIRFTTAKNVEAAVSITVYKVFDVNRPRVLDPEHEDYFEPSRTEKGYKVAVSRKDSGMNKRKEFSGHLESLPLLLENGLDAAETFAKTRVQIASKQIERGEREYASDGTPKLFENETLDEFYKSQEMPAGIVINNKGKYQPFFSRAYGSHRPLPYNDAEGGTSLSSDVQEGRRFLSYETNHYAKKDKAVAFLVENGFSGDGKWNNELDIEEFVEGFRSYNNQYGYTDRSNSDNVAIFDMPQGQGEISIPHRVDDPELGILYRVDCKYTDEISGQTYNKSYAIENCEPGEAISNASSAMLDYCAKQIPALYEPESDITFDDDSRSLEDKKQHHLERFKYHKEKFEKHSARADEFYISKGETLPPAWDKLISRHQNFMDKHQEMFNTYSNEKQVESLSDMSL